MGEATAASNYDSVKFRSDVMLLVEGGLQGFVVVNIAGVGFSHVVFHAEFDITESNVNVRGLRFVS